MGEWRDRLWKNPVNDMTPKRSAQLDKMAEKKSVTFPKAHIQADQAQDWVAKTGKVFYKR
ncbi:MAG: hypothetical protein ACFB0E_18160 [Leptolyngbyaceae cyanobacterium]